MFHHLYNATLGADRCLHGEVSEASKQSSTTGDMDCVPARKWLTLDLAWDEARNACVIKSDGRRMLSVRQQRMSVGGASFLRLVSTSTIADAGVLIERVTVNIIE